MKFPLHAVKILLIMCLGFIAALFLIPDAELQVSARELTVDSGGQADYSTIQNAINDAEDGDSILVKAGIYQENLVIDKKIVLEGESSGNTVIDGNGTDDVVLVKSDKVEIKGFKIINSGRGVTTNAGIEIYDDFVTCEISDCELTENEYGIYLTNDNSWITIEECSIYSNYKFGIWIHDSKSNTIKNNSIYSNIGGGIYISNSRSNIIEKNLIYSNLDFGVGLSLYSIDNKINYNSIYNNTNQGILVWDKEASVDARYNWWGDSSGPYHSKNNPSGKGDEVSKYVNFEPWLDEYGNTCENRNDNGSLLLTFGAIIILLSLIISFIILILKNRGFKK